MRYLLVIIGVLLGTLCKAETPVFELDSGFVVAEGVDYIEYYLSTDTVSSPQERYFQMKSSHYDERVKRYLFVTTQSQKWLFFKVHNPQAIPFDFLVEMGNFGLSQADYYVFFQDTIIASGVVATRGGLKTSDYYDRNIVIPFTAQPGLEYAFLIRVHTNAPVFDLPVIIWNKKDKYLRSQGIEFGRGLFYGVLLFFITVTGFVVFLIRERSNVYYWLYLSLGGMLLLMKSGIPLEVFWPGRSYLDFIIRNFFLYAYLLVTIRFLKEFLSFRIESGWYSTVLNVFMVIGCILLLLYVPVSFLNVMFQDTLLIIQTAYINLTNLLVISVIFWALPKVKDKGTLIISLLYYFLFSAYLFNPFIEFGFWTGKLIGHILLYTGGLAISILLSTVTALRIRAVVGRNQQVKYELSNLNKKYSHSLVEGQEKERRRVAEELHDGIGAHLSAVKMKLSSLRSSIQDEEEREYIDRILENIDESTQQVREMSHELMPPTLMRYGLEPALTDMVRKYQRTYPIKLYLKSNLRQHELDKISEMILYRLMHQLLEALVHGQTHKAEIKLIILPSVSNAAIQVKYTGGSPISQTTSEEFEALKALVNLLQGRVDNFMSSIWDDEMNIEVPVATLDPEEEEPANG